MKFWILTIHSLNNPFIYIEVDQIFQMDIKINTDITSVTSVFRAESISAGDKILGFVGIPLNEVRYSFKVIENNGTNLKLKKELESRYGVSLKRVEGLDNDAYNHLIGADPNTVRKIIEVSEQFFHRVEQEMVEPFIYELAGTKKREDDQVKEAEEPYIQPMKDPKADKLSHNLITFGAPGTGKSFKLEEVRKEYFSNNYERVTFHPNYSYGQFVGTYKPKPMKGINEITYELVPGPLLRLLAKALVHTDRNYVMIVEEINRANTAAVFGDIFQLLDRDSNGRSEYYIMLSEEVREYLEGKTNIAVRNNELYLPDNLYIWATMNTADQGVYPMDSAFKRRFDFDYIGIDDNEGEISDIHFIIPGVGTINWNTFRKTLNEFLLERVRNMKEDKLIGPFYIKKNILEADEKILSRVFRNKLLMYLSEDVLKSNKTTLLKFNSFSKTVQEYNEGRNVFSDEFTEVLKSHLMKE